MSHSVLLQLARDSIAEVLQAKKTINLQELIEKHPLLNETISTTVNIYINNELRGNYINENEDSLIKNILIGAKRAAFEDVNFLPLSTSEYLHCEVELILQTQDGVISEKDSAILKAVIT
ncbi:MAG: AMMECR1 domain-containing protein [Sulfurimonas sp.]